MAIGAQMAAAPDQLLLSLRGSGQALYVGLAEDAFVVASEPYGLVEETATYLRMDGETPADPERAVGHPRPGRGARRRARRARSRASAASRSTARRSRSRRRAPARRDHDARHRPRRLPALPAEGDLGGAGVVPQDAARQDRRGDGGMLAWCSAPRRSRTTSATASRDRRDPARRRHRPGHGRDRGPEPRRRARPRFVGDRSSRAEAVVATELSGFDLDDDMSDTLVVAISQSGTTTDTNRTVDLVAAAGRHVLAIVNRRNSDLVDKADGVLYTSDGRDVEMAVPSTKAFYAQIAAGYLLALAHRRRGRRRSIPTVLHELLARCARCPTRCTTCSRSGRRSPRSRSGTCRRAATGRSSATA